jgi:hypothetical protein
VISTKPGLNRFLRVTPTGLLRIDRKAVTTETRLDGKYLLRCSDPHLPAEDITLGYKQLLEVARGWRDMIQIIDLRPVHHRLEDRIRAHVLLCWLALLLIRIIENTTAATWNRLAAELGRLHVITYTVPPGPSNSAPSSPRPSATSTPPSGCPSPRRSSSWPPRATDQPQRRRLVTHPSGVRIGILARQHPNPRTSRSS